MLSGYIKRHIILIGAFLFSTESLAYSGFVVGAAPGIVRHDNQSSLASRAEFTYFPKIKSYANYIHSYSRLSYENWFRNKDSDTTLLGFDAGLCQWQPVQWRICASAAILADSELEKFSQVSFGAGLAIEKFIGSDFSTSIELKGSSREMGRAEFSETKFLSAWLVLRQY